MSTSRVPAVIDALVTICTADTGLQAANVTVYDGPVVTDAPAQYVLWIGLTDPDANEAPIAAESEQRFPALGTRVRDEEGTIHCVAEAWSGDRDVRTIRNKVYSIVAAVELLVRADATLSGSLSPSSGWGEVGGLQLRQNNVDTGAVARLSFHVSYHARI